MTTSPTKSTRTADATRAFARQLREAGYRIHSTGHGVISATHDGYHQRFEFDGLRWKRQSLGPVLTGRR